MKNPHHFGKPKYLHLFCLYAAVCLVLAPAVAGAADSAGDYYNLDRTIREAVEVSLQLKVSQEDSAAAAAEKKSAQTQFLPTFSTSYQYTHNSEIVTIPLFGLLSPENQFTWVTSASQPLFTGFALLNQYEIAALGLDAAKINEKLVRQTIVYDANNVYFSLLKAQKFVVVAQDTVKQIESQVEVARNYYQVGMTPLNDYLQAEVALANAKQNLVIAEDNLAAAEASFNTFVRRPINAPLRVEDILTYTPIAISLDSALAAAQAQRPELAIADRRVEIAEKEVQLAKKDYYPTVTLQGNYYRSGTEPDVNGGPGIVNPPPHFWNIQATANWNFWEWGRTAYGVREKLHRLVQAEDRKTETQENLSLEVKRAYLKTEETEKNIATAETAIEQAKENLRINQERYKEQVATTTDVLDAQTLLARAMTNYYSALYDFKIAKAALLKAMGQETLG